MLLVKAITVDILSREMGVGILPNAGVTVLKQAHTGVIVFTVTEILQINNSQHPKDLDTY